MEVSINKEFDNGFLSHREFKKLFYEINDEIMLLDDERFPSKIIFTPQMAALPYARYDKKTDTLEIFMSRLFLSENYFTKESLRAVIKHILTHEIIEPIERKNVSSVLKAWFGRVHYSLVPASPTLLNLKYDDQGMEAMCEDFCEDIKTDRRCLYSNEQALGFSTLHKELLEVEKNQLRDLKIEKIDGKFYSNVEPYKLMCLLLSGMRKAVVNMYIKKRPYYLGRFYSNLSTHTIGKKIRYPELQRCLYKIIGEFKKEDLDYKIIYAYSMEFVKRLNYRV